jgi:ABC-2 type transport system permease protein
VRSTPAWWVIARAGVLERLRERRFLALLLLAWGPFIVRAVQIYASASFRQLSFLAPGPETFREFLDQQSLFLLFITIYAGSSLIAGDRRANALQVYLSKPITRLDYVVGKALVLAVFLLAASWLPAMVLLALEVIFAGSMEFLIDNPRLVFAITGFCVLEVGVICVAMLAISSMSANSRFVGVVYAGIVFFSGAVNQVLSDLTRSSAWGWLSSENVFDALGIAIFGTRGEPAVSLAMAAGAVTAVVVAAAVILERRVRPMDIVT